MSKSAKMPLSKEVKILLAQVAVVCLSLGGLVFYTWALFSVGVLFVNFKFIASMLGGIVVTLALLCLSVRRSSVLIRAVLRHKNEWKRYWIEAIFTLVVLSMTFLSAATTIEWGIGASLRELPFLSFLPEGNLLVAGGKAGWTYTLLIVAMVAGSLGTKIPGWSKKLVLANNTATPPTKRMKSVSRGSSPVLTNEVPSSSSEDDSFNEDLPRFGASSSFKTAPFSEPAYGVPSFGTPSFERRE